MAKSVESQNLRSRIRRDRRRRTARGVFRLILVLALAALTSYLFFSSVIVQESSMSPTLENGDRVFINRLAYAVTGVRRGDVIAYRSRSSIDTGIHIKRVIGLPGETVQIRDGLILINGSTYIESKDFPNITNAGLAAEGVTLGSDEYFVLGDNRNNSEDSRFADVGNIGRETILGKVWFRPQPLRSVGFVR
ncbi:MAG: signal peptidase I [Clostridiales bacterium]|uniref:signal peptidase I n=1 Tax=Chordicoccus furentiruminis TaxID=2709410 RepID=UPI0023A852E0|nr:signal peptidase I [Chordicoccus furentiruminis]MCI6173190.1 signal peptidase I [Clostridiales bacterium]